MESRLDTFSGGSGFGIFGRIIPITMVIIQPSKRNMGQVPSNVFLTKRLPLIPRVIKDIDWLWFNLMLKIFYKNKIKSADCVITHYPIHYNSTKHNKKNIVLSHGIDWVEPASNYVDRVREKSAKNILEVINEINL